MMPFRYFLDSAYVVPALRKREIGLPMGRRKSVIVGLVLLAHGGLIWGLVNFIAPVPPPIEFVETQVILEQVTPEQPTPTPIPPSPQVQQRAVDAPAVQPKQVLTVNEKAVIKEVVKPSVPTPVTPIVPPAPTAPPVQQVAQKAPQLTENRLSAAKCSSAPGLRFHPPMSIAADKNMTLLVRRDRSDRPASVNLVGSSGDAALDAWVAREARAKLRFYKDGEQCDGVQGTVSVKIKAND